MSQPRTQSRPAVLPRAVQPSMAALLIAALAVPSASAQQTIVASTANRTAVLGSAYRSEREGLIGQSCVTGTHDTTGTPTSSFNFTQELSEREASSELGFGAGGRARFGVVEASASARFMRASTSTAYSVSAVWLSDYRLPVEKLTGDAKLSPIGNSVRADDDRWAQTCGDEFVTEIVRGGKLFFSIRVDFSSAESKQSFESRFKVSGPLFDVEGDLKTASKEFSKDTHVTVNALQVGGDVSKLTAIFPSNVEGRAGFVQCTLGAFDKCADFIGSAIQYATDTQHGFPSQFTTRLADLEYRTAPYTSVGVFPNNYPGLTEAIAESRKRLHEIFEEQLKDEVLADRLLELPLEAVRHQRISAARDIIAANLDAILVASRTCYDTPGDCPRTVNALHTTDFDSSALTLPPLPVVSMRLFTTSAGLLSRAASLRQTVPTQVVPADVSPAIAERLKALSETIGNISVERSLSVACVIAPNPPPCGDSARTLTGRARRLEDLRDSVVGGEVSAVLYVDGVGLKDARLFFENQELKIIPLTFQAGGFPNKYSPTSAFIVIATTRSNPGWRDVDMEAESKKLMRNSMPKADGAFYVLIEDQFGRSVRADLAYFSWKFTQTDRPNNRVFEDFRYTWRQRWWDPATNGTMLDGTDPWSESGYAQGDVDRPRGP